MYLPQHSGSAQQQQSFVALEKYLPHAGNRVVFLKKNIKLFTKGLMAIDPMWCEDFAGEKCVVYLSGQSMC